MVPHKQIHMEPWIGSRPRRLQQDCGCGDRLLQEDQTAWGWKRTCSRCGKRLSQEPHFSDGYPMLLRYTSHQFSIHMGPTSDDFHFLDNECRRLWHFGLLLFSDDRLLGQCYVMFFLMKPMWYPCSFSHFTRHPWNYHQCVFCKMSEWCFLFDLQDKGGFFYGGLVRIPCTCRSLVIFISLERT